MKAIIIFLFISSLYSCKKHTINKSQSLSRITTKIQFNTSNKPYSVKEEVGGEQINSTIIKAMANDIFIIDVKADNDSLNYYIDGQSIQVQTLENNPLKRKVMVKIHTNIELSFYSHPESCFYDLTITKL